jgi:hypothetical protein
MTSMEVEYRLKLIIEGTVEFVRNQILQSNFNCLYNIRNGIMISVNKMFTFNGWF